MIHTTPDGQGQEAKEESMKTRFPSVVTQVSCPYCGHVNILDLAEEVRDPPQVISCGDGTTAGCGRWFAMAVRFNPVVRIYRMEGVKT